MLQFFYYRKKNQQETKRNVFIFGVGSSEITRDALRTKSPAREEIIQQNIKQNVFLYILFILKNNFFLYHFDKKKLFLLFF